MDKVCTNISDWYQVPYIQFLALQRLITAVLYSNLLETPTLLVISSSLPYALYQYERQKFDGTCSDQL
jgi:hypothetical protein